MSGIGYHASLVERPKSYPSLAPGCKRKRMVAQRIEPLEESVQQLEVERVNGRAEHGISLPKRRDALLADLLLRNPLV